MDPVVFRKYYGPATSENLKRLYLTQLSSSGRMLGFKYDGAQVDVAPELLEAYQKGAELTQTEIAALLLQEGLYALKPLSLMTTNRFLASQ